MQLYGTFWGTLVWLGIGIGVGVLAAAQQNQVTWLIAAGWILLAVFSFLEYQKEDEEDDTSNVEKPE